MRGPAYYNEIDPYAARFLRNLIAAGHIAPGDVDTRDILDVRPDDLRGYRQCHFFAGVGVWSYALRRAGWGDDRPVWTGSCPCQPFSAAGAGLGFSDERHLWPHFYWLISERRPAVVLGEQVASKDADPWIDLVCDDLEAVDYAVGAIPFPSAGVGAPHIRDRLYWVAHAAGPRLAQQRGRWKESAGSAAHRAARGLADAHVDRLQGSAVETIFGAGWRQEGYAAGRGDVSLAGRVADADGWHASAERQQRRREQRQQPEDGGCGRVALGRLADTDGYRCEQRGVAAATAGHWNPDGADGRIDRLEPAGPTNGFWRDADWLLCRDGKWRPVEPGTFPLAHGAPARVGRLRAYGNGLCAPAAQAFIESVRDCLP